MKLISTMIRLSYIEIFYANIIVKLFTIIALRPFQSFNRQLFKAYILNYFDCFGSY